MGRPITADDLHWFAEGTHDRAWEFLGSYPEDGATHFGVWAPNAVAVSVIRDGNHWVAGADPLTLGDGGIWTGTVPGIGAGSPYKYAVVGPDGVTHEKADPFAFHAEVAPRTASVVWEETHRWTDDAWMAQRGEHQAHTAPISIYEVHLGSWMPPAPVPYRDIADPLIDHVTRLGFTHVEFMPLTEHPYYGSWGYQATGWFAPTSRYGTPGDFAGLVDRLHGAGIGVILDWAPSHFATDTHGLGRFDGTPLYEHTDPRRAVHPDWGSYVFDHGRGEVRSFLRSSANFWIERFHIDAIRVDAVASMLHLDYSRRPGEWEPNRWGGRENLESLDFIRQLNESVQTRHPGVRMIAEESTAWFGVTHPPERGGLGFAWKWDMGWMNDTLRHLSRRPEHRRFHHDELTFRGLYVDSEAFITPLAHDEVVHGKGSLLGRMPGDDHQRFATLRLLLAHQWTIPGKPLLFMGGEFAQPDEWNHDHALPLHLLDVPAHRGVARMVTDLNALMRAEPALHHGDHRPDGHRHLCDHAADGVLAWYRLDPDGGRPLLVAMGTTPLTRTIDVASNHDWIELFNSDAEIYGGSGVGNLGRVTSEDGRISVTVPPLGVVVLAQEAHGSQPMRAAP